MKMTTKPDSAKDVTRLFRNQVFRKKGEPEYSLGEMDGYAANMSGLGKRSTIPPEVRGWNWGAFLLPIIWGILNHVWISLLCLIPGVGFPMIFVLGAKGNEWARRSSEWDSIEQFRREQRDWALWGLGVWVASIILMVIPLLIAALTL